MKVNNRQCIRNLCLKQFKASKTRNIIAVAAIALMTLLFTSLFTIALSINEGFEQSNFRQCGGFSHATFKYLTNEQLMELKSDPLIKEWGIRQVVGMPVEPPFNKTQVEISYCDKNQAHWMYCDPVYGRLPNEGTNEAAADAEILRLLGIEPSPGASFAITFEVDGRKTTQEFTLCGWWEHDEAIFASHVLIPKSRAEAILDEAGVIPGKTDDNITGSLSLDVMFSSSFDIAGKVEKVLSNHGYQNESYSAGDNYIATGVNWSYSGSQLAQNADFATVLAVVAALMLIVFTGYLIIYNIFQISVSNDIRFYGLLKTIGTTPRQLKSIIRMQAALLCLMGIPLGLIGGWLVGSALTPIIISQLNGIINTVSSRPLIFVVSALFALFTVMISCLRPGKLAGKISPVEAIRYTDAGSINGRKQKYFWQKNFWHKKLLNKKYDKKAFNKGSDSEALLISMAEANLGRNTKKTVITIISLALSVVLLNLTVTFANGFDMDKYLSQFVSADFIVANAGYFRTGRFFSADTVLSESDITDIGAACSISEGGRIYGNTSNVQEFITEDYYRLSKGRWYSDEQLDIAIKNEEKTDGGLIACQAQIYGMEPFALDYLKVVEGDISKLYEPSGSYIAAVYLEDDYGALEMDSNWAKVGDKVTFRYVQEFEYFNPETGEIYPEGIDLETVPRLAERSKTYRDVSYTVAAIVTVPYSLSYRYFGNDEFILNDKTFIRDTMTDKVMLYAFNTEAENTPSAESFLSDYTGRVITEYDYESKSKREAEFESFRSMFMLLGSALSFIIGLVGILNFINTILTGIITRKREFAMLESVGMTKKQLERLLVYEGLFFSLGAGLLSLIIALVLSPLISSALEDIFWFFTYDFTIAPILILLPCFAVLGTIVPLTVYRFVGKTTIVERLREAEE